MKIDYTPQLDFSDVLIRPKRTVINSRSEVNITRNFKFLYSNIKLNVVPIIASNMDTIGTFNVYNSLSKYNMITCMHKFYKVDDYKNYILNNNSLDKNEMNPNLFMVSTGISDKDFEKFSQKKRLGT